tara:strand:- start:77 stop:979 length:903 start_codon:yes stop_codon:yes gene_type:complete
MNHQNQVIPTTASFHNTWTNVGDQFAIPQNSSSLSQQILWNDRIFHGTSSHPNPEDKMDKILTTTQAHDDEDFHDKIEQRVGFKINNVYLFKEAFIHKSAQKQHSCSNERLEFLGDSVINLSVADFVYRSYPNEEEGFMTKLRTKLVNRFTLSYLAKQMKLHELIITSRQINMKESQNDKIMEDAFEAFIGALYLDVGFEKSSKFVIDIMKSAINFNEIMIDSNYKDILLRHAQKEYSTLPEYIVSKSEGPPHKRTFYVFVKVGTEEYGKGEGSTKKQAEQNAAKQTLQLMNVNIQDFIK